VPGYSPFIDGGDYSVGKLAGLAGESRKGRERIWALKPQPLLAASEYLGEISSQWEDALNRLRDFVEEPEG